MKRSIKVSEEKKKMNVEQTHLKEKDIFEYEKDVAITENFPSTHTSRKNSQGSFVFHDDPSHAKEEHTHLLTTLASSVVNTHLSYMYHKKAYPHTEGYKVVFESEVVKASLNPLWRPFRVGFYELSKGNTSVQLLIECYDWDRFKPSDFIGSFRVTVQELLDCKEAKRFQLISKKGVGTGTGTGFLVFKSAMSQSDLLYCDFKACGADLVKKNIKIGLSDPYFVIKTPISINERRNTFSFSYDGDLVPTVNKMKYGTQTHPATEGYREIYESPVIKNTINPDWGLFQLGFYDMCKGIPETKLLFECYDYNDIWKDVLIGTAEISVQTIIDTRGKIEIPLRFKNEKETGIIYLQCKPSNSATILRK
eukprot:Phypoly_transcript_08149.p1 GENE.Phypoly_transcript_08149~~Phypoly_transcript_08149.p1  ORF type:complete len:365 (-),score=41.59 Phypoly_transcript_08149:90-1184(-)